MSTAFKRENIQTLTSSGSGTVPMFGTESLIVCYALSNICLRSQMCYLVLTPYTSSNSYFWLVLSVFFLFIFFSSYKASYKSLPFIILKKKKSHENKLVYTACCRYSFRRYVDIWVAQFIFYELIKLENNLKKTRCTTFGTYRQKTITPLVWCSAEVK